MKRRRRGQILAISVVTVMAVAIGLIAWIVLRDDKASERQFAAVRAGDLVSMQPWSEVHVGNAEIWKIRYLTSDRSEKVRTATALVSVPRKVKAGAPLVAYAHGTTGIARRCAPSERGTPMPTDGGAVQSALDQGWVVVAPDYSGLGSAGDHGYLVGKEAAHDLLDALRAARKMPDLELGEENFVWGQSQGGHAALWAGVEAARYAPELPIVGVAAVAPPTDLAAMMAANVTTPGITRLHAYVLASWRKVYPGSGVWAEVDPAKRPLVNRIGALCGFDPVGADEAALQLPVFPDTAPGTPMGRLLRINSPTGRIKAPVLISQGGMDQVVPMAQQKAWVAQRCAEGQKIDLREHPALDHLGIAYTSDAEIVAWIKGRLAGKPLTPTC
ncbi:lipase family protein [Nocardioides sp. Bht2]|uniref:lipase family protein n=1 Tax=Nocardioides sp. Bht2 TaxID=3392297 RepID=UPI0039B5A618